MKLLTQQEELVLLAIWNLKDNAYLVTVREYLSKATSKEWSIGAVYMPLDRVEKMGYAESKLGDPTNERGGRRKKFYKLTKDGFAVLGEMKKVNERLWNTFPDMAMDEGETV